MISALLSCKFIAACEDFSVSPRNSFIRGRLSVMGNFHQLCLFSSSFSVVLCPICPISVIRGQNFRLRRSRRLPPEDRHLACLGRWASCPSIPTDWKPIFRDSLEGYPPKTKIPDVDVASGKLIVESLGKSKVEEKVLNQSRQQLFRNL